MTDLTPLGRAPARCRAINQTRGLACDREPGHVGVHTQHDGNGVRAWTADGQPISAWDLLGIDPNHPGGRNAPRPEHAAIIRAADVWRRWFVGSLVRMQDLHDTEQALLDALAEARCGMCRQCVDCRRDAPFATEDPR